MSEIRTNLTVSGESSEYRGNISISVVTLNSNLVDTQSSFRTNIEVSLNIENDTISSIKTDLELNNVSLDFYLVDMTKLNQSILYFSKFFNMNFEPELIWEMLAQGTNEQINASHLSDALSKYVSVDSLTNVYNSITNLGNTINGHINNNIVHLTDEEKYFLNSIMTNPPWSTGTAGLFEYINVGDNNNVIWAVRPLLNAGKDVGIISNTFISCRGVDITAGGSGGGITRQDLFYILKGEPQDSSEYINSKYLRLDDILDDYATEEWVNSTFIKEEKDPTVPSHVKKITQDQIYSWDLVASLFSVSEDDTYVLVNDNRGFVSTSFLSCKGLDVSAANSGSGIDMSLVWYYLGLDGNEQINKSHITTALNGYATEDWVSSNYVLGSTYTNQIQTINTNISKKADKTLIIIAGNGLTGGGTLEENRTITLGNPSTITDETDNTVSEESHTHKINKASTTVVGIVKLYDALDSNSNILALTANQGKILGDRVILLEDMWENKNTYLLAKKDRGIVSNSFISVKGLDTSAPQTGGNFDRSSLFSILSSSPQSGEYINIEYLDLSDYATKSDLTSKISLDEADKRYVLLTSFTTLNNKVNNFLEGSDTDNIINKWKELEAFLEGQTETSTLADLLSYKLDTSVYNTFIGTLGTAAYKEADDFLVSTTKYAIADAVGGNALNALNANRLGEQEPTYYAKASDLQILLNIIGVDANGDVYIKKNGETARNFYTYGAISFGGVGTGGGGTGGVTALSALSDVALGTLSDGQALVWDANKLKWVNKNISGGLAQVTVKLGTVSYTSDGGVVSLPAYPSALSQLSNDVGYITLSADGTLNTAAQIKAATTRNSVTLIPDKDCGLYMATTGDWMHIAGNGSNMYIYNGEWDSAGKGNYNKGIVITQDNKIGVGLRNPSVKFEVAGNVKLTEELTINANSSSRDSWLRFTDDSSTEVYAIGIRRPTATYGLQYYKNGEYHYILHQGNYTDYVYSKASVDTKLSGYLPLSGGTIENTSYGALVISRKNSDGYSAISYHNTTNGVLGYIGVGGSGSSYPYQPTFINNDGTYQIIHSGNIGDQSVSYASRTGALVDSSNKAVAYVSGTTFYIGDSVFPTTEAHILGKQIKLRYGANAYTGLTVDTNGDTIVDGRFNVKTFININRDGATGSFYDTSKLGFEIEPAASNVKLRTYAYGQTTNTKLLVLTKQNVLIGTDADNGYTLQVNGGVYAKNNLYVDKGDTGGVLIGDYGNTIEGYSNNSYTNLHLNYLSSGNMSLCRGGGKVGIANANPSYPLDVIGKIVSNTTNNSIRLIPDADCGVYMTSNGQWLHIAGSGSSMYIYNGEWDSAGKGNYNKGIVITSSNYIGIGKTNPSSKLDVNGGITAINMTLSASIPIVLTATGDGVYNKSTLEVSSSGIVFERARTSDSGSASVIPFIISQRGGGEALKLDGNNLTVAGAITFGSDARYKNKLSDATISLEDIANAPLFNYRWTDRDDNKVHLGTTAQYWNNTNFRNAVCPTKDKSLWTMSYSEIAMGNTIVIARELIPIKSDVQILKERVDKLESILTQHNIKFD